MDPLLSSAASGMRARIESLDMLANNLANTGTAGFKLDRESYSLYVAPEALDPSSPPPSTLPVVEKRWTDFSQASLTPTGNPLDLALASRGFFAIDGPNGTLYTRNGSLRLSPDGVLTTEDGYAVRDVNGTKIQLQPGVPFVVAADGSIQQGGAQAGQIAVVEFPNPEMLAKFGKNYFQAPAGAAAPQPAASVEVRQGMLETSNVAAPEAAVRLINLMRQFEMLQKAVLMGGEMNRQAIEVVAKPTS